MTARAPRRLLPAVLAVGMMAMLSACSPAASGEGTGSGAPSSPSEDTAGSATPSDQPTGPLTCDTLISATTVDALKKLGWTSEQREFSVGPEVVPAGLLCLWADFTHASDRGQMYGWAPIDAERAATLQQQLVEQGWIREDSDRGVYITIDPDFAFEKDADGYGSTYLFGDGWVTFSDTRQGLVLIEAPR